MDFNNRIIRAIANIEKYVSSNVIYYKGFNLKLFVIAQKYIDFLFGKRKDRIKKLVYFIVHYWFILFKRFKRNSIFTIKVNYNLSNPNKILFIQSFSLENYRHFLVLEGLISLYRNEQGNFVILTIFKDVYKLYCSKGLRCIYVGIPRFYIKKEFLRQKYSLNEAKVYSLSRELIDFVEIILDDIKPSAIITTQDFLFIDQFFTIIGKAKGIKTMTHQHGAIPETDSSLYKFLFSDYMFIWGKSSFDRLKKYIPEEQLIIVGTEKFNYLSRRQGQEGIYVVIATTNLPFESNYHIIKKLLSNLNSFSTCILIKIHPSQSIKKWNTNLEKLRRNLKINVKIQVKNNDLPIILENAALVISFGSTVSIDSKIAGIPVFEINIENKSLIIKKNRDDCFKSIECLSHEVQQILEDKNYREKYIQQQSIEFKNEIFSFNSSRLEYQFISQLLTKE